LAKTLQRSRIDFLGLVGKAGMACFGLVFCVEKCFFKSLYNSIQIRILEGNDLVNTGSYCKSSEVLGGELKTFVEDPKSKGLF
jgi:hypothetical protein